MSSTPHFRVVCRFCGTLITQCRCFSTYKVTQHGICEACQAAGKKDPGDELLMQQPPPPPGETVVSAEQHQYAVARIEFLEGLVRQAHMAGWLAGVMTGVEKVITAPPSVDDLKQREQASWDASEVKRLGGLK